MKQRIHLGLGTNLGRRRDNLQQAIDILQADFAVTAVSSLYETPPWGILDQPAFINMAAVVETTWSPMALLPRLKEIEREIGREKTIKWGPRLIDIDILLAGAEIIATEQLRVPHPFMLERPFVLGPLADIAPDVIHPQAGKTIAALFAAIDDQSLTILPEMIQISTSRS